MGMVGVVLGVYLVVCEESTDFDIVRKERRVGF